MTHSVCVPPCLFSVVIIIPFTRVHVGVKELGVLPLCVGQFAVQSRWMSWGPPSPLQVCVFLSLSCESLSTHLVVLPSMPTHHYQPHKTVCLIFFVHHLNLWDFFLLMSQFLTNTHYNELCCKNLTCFLQLTLHLAWQNKHMVNSLLNAKQRPLSE